MAFERKISSSTLKYKMKLWCSTKLYKDMGYKYRKITELRVKSLYCASLDKSLQYLTSAIPSEESNCEVLASTMPCISDITVIYVTLSPLFHKNKTIKVMCCLERGNFLKLFLSLLLYQKLSVFLFEYL